MKISKTEIEELERRYRATFINSLAGYKQPFLIGTRSKEGQNNLAIFNSLIHLGANPALFGVLFRPDTVRRDTLTNILETGYYTLNFIEGKDWQKAHQTSAKYEHEVSEFDAVGLTPSVAEDFWPPFVKESPVKIGMKYESKIEIPVNGTILVIGSIETIELDNHLIAEDGFVDLTKADVLGCIGLDAYFEPNKVSRLSYAIPEKWPDIIG